MEYIKPALKQRCEIEDNYRLTKLERWLFTAKAVICILLNRWSIKTDYTAIAIAELTSGSYQSAEYTVYWCENLYIGRGLWEWYVSIDENSWP